MLVAPNRPQYVCTCTPPLRTVDAFRHSCESNNPPQSRPYVAGISDDIASSLRGIIRSILIREDYRCRIFAPPKARFTSRVDRTTGANVYCLFIAATRELNERRFSFFPPFFLSFFFFIREIFRHSNTRVFLLEGQKFRKSRNGLLRKIHERGYLSRRAFAKSL